MSFGADRMQFLSIPTLWKSAFAWVLLGALTIGHAQTPDQGSLVLSGTISKTTCVLNFGDAQSTLAGRKTLSFGSISTANIPTDSGLSFATKQTVILSVTNADGNTCDGIGSGKWDVGVSIDSSKLSPSFLFVLLSDGDRSATPRTFTEEVGVILQSTKNGTVGTTNVRLDQKPFSPVGGGGAFTLLSSPSSTAPSLLATDKLALSAIFFTLSRVAKSPGAYTVAIPLTVFYQ
jgi:type 1 fimbria pilin